MQSFGAMVTWIPRAVRMMALHGQEVRACGYLWVCSKCGSLQRLCFQGARKTEAEEREGEALWVSQGLSVSQLKVR